MMAVKKLLLLLLMGKKRPISFINLAESLSERI